MRFVIFGAFCLLLSSCAKEFMNPYDPATPPDSWMPRDFVLDTLDNNSVRLSWQQDELHIDGYTVRRDISGDIREFIIPFDSLMFTDLTVIDSTATDTCSEVAYSVMARAGDNLSSPVGIDAPLYLPLSAPAFAGADITVTNTATSVTLSASEPQNGERGEWTIVSGTGGVIADPTDPTTAFTGQPCTSYTLRWTITGCGQSSDEVSVSFSNGLTSASAGPDQTFSDNTTQTNLSANTPSILEIGQWTILSGTGGTIADPADPTTAFTGQSCTSYTLRWTITGCGESADDVIISFSEATTQPNAGADLSFTNNTTQTNIAANAPAAGEIGQWSIVSGFGGTITNPNSPSTTFSGSSCETYILAWSITGACGELTDQLTISFEQQTTQANAGSDQSFTDNTTQTMLSANSPGVGETGHWSIVSGSGGSFTDSNSPNTSFTGQPCQAYELRWSIAGACNTNNDDLLIDFEQLTTQANAGNDIEASSLEVTLSGNVPGTGELGQWSVISGPNGSFSEINNPESNFIGGPGSNHVLRWTIIGTCSQNFDEMIVVTPLIDIDGNTYETVSIGNQVWMAENLKTSRYSNGDDILNLQPASTWSTSTEGAWVHLLNNDYYEFSAGGNYGKLYNGYSVMDSRNVCPTGWSVPSDAQWTVLTNFLGGLGVAGGKMKRSGIGIWHTPNAGATNESGFTGTPGGWRYDDGSFLGDEYEGRWWSITETSSGAWSRGLSYGVADAYRLEYPLNYGLSVRCVRD